MGRENVRKWLNLFLLYRSHINEEIPDEINRRGFVVASYLPTLNLMSSIFDAPK